MHRAHHERRNIDDSFVKHLIFPEKNISKLLYIPFGKKTTNQSKNPIIRTLYIVRMLQFATKETISLFNHGTPKSSRKNTFAHAFSVNKSKSK